MERSVMLRAVGLAALIFCARASWAINAPTIFSAPSATAKVAAPFYFQIQATNLPTSYDAGPLPTGLTVVTGTGVISGKPVAAGTYYLTVTAANSAGSGSAPFTLTVAKGNQTVTFTPPPLKFFDDSPFELTAVTATSGQPVSFALVSGPATVSGDTVTLTGTVGAVSISASQAGDDDYNAAPAVKQSITVAGHLDVTKLSATFTFGGSKDNCAVAGTLRSAPAANGGTTLYAGLVFQGLSIVVNVDGAQAGFVLDTKGKPEKSTHGTLALKAKFQKKVKLPTYVGGDLPFTATLKGPLAGNWQSAGIDPALSLSKKPLALPVQITFNGIVYASSPTVLVTAKINKGGKFALQK